MDDFPRALIVFFAAVNPAAAVLAFGAATPGVSARRRGELAAAAGLLALALLALAAALRESLLDLLQASPESFEVAAGIVMVVGALRPLWPGRTPDAAPGEGRPPAWHVALAPLAVPVLASPAAVAAALVYFGRYDTAPTLAAVAVVLAFSAAAAALAPVAARAPGSAALSAVARLTAALLVFVALALTVDAIRSV